MKRVYSKEKEFAPLGANSFRLELSPFQKGIGEQEIKQEVTKLSPMSQIEENLPSVSSSLEHCTSIQNGNIMTSCRLKYV